VVPGNTSKTMWTDYLSYDALPKSLDPASGFNQNVNEPPWFMTMPMLDASKYPAYLSGADVGGSLFRVKRSYRLLTESPKLSYEQFLTNKLSTRVEMADALLPDLLKAAPDSEAKRVLEKWDRSTDTTSRGAVLFKIFTDIYFANSDVPSHLRVKFDPQHPVDSAYGVADPEWALKALGGAAERVKKTYGSLDVAWGDVYRYASGNADLPGDGGPPRLGVFRTIEFAKKVGDRYYASHGETFVCAIEFAEKQNAQCSLSYGNFSQPGSIHLEDQLPLMVAKKLHPVWRDRKEIEGNLEKREKF
jgi:acyl-homoserine-lactone acylase